MYFGLVPYDLRDTSDLGGLSVDQLVWRRGEKPKCQHLSELDPDTHIVVYPSTKRVLGCYSKLPCHTDLLLTEPTQVHGKYYRLISFLCWRFSTVITRYPEHAIKRNNVLTFNPMEAWVDPSVIDSCNGNEKTKLCSLIASSKRDLVGHRLRHSIVDHVQSNKLPIDVLGKGYAPFTDKVEGLLPFKYSIVIENDREPHYFTEKLLDAFLCRVIPIYWGAQNIGKYFDTSGIVVCESTDDMLGVINNLDVSPPIIDADALERNRIAAIAYVDRGSKLLDSLAKFIGEKQSHDK